MELVSKSDYTSLEMTVQAMQSKNLLPKSIKNSDEALAIVAMGERLGMDPLISLQSLEFIQGQLTVKAKMVSGLLSKHGISTQVIQDYEPVYETVLKPVPLYRTNADGTTEPVMKDGKVCYALNEDGTVKTREEKKEIDRVTEIKFLRFNPTIGMTVENNVKFYWSDAVSAQWDKKDNWKKNPRYMMYARTLTRGARMVAADVIGGLYDNLEWADAVNEKIDLD